MMEGTTEVTLKALGGEEGGAGQREEGVQVLS